MQSQMAPRAKEEGKEMQRLTLIEIATWLLIMIGVVIDNKPWMLSVVIPLYFIYVVLVMICDKLNDIKEDVK